MSKSMSDCQSIADTPPAISQSATSSGLAVQQRHSSRRNLSTVLPLGGRQLLKGGKREVLVEGAKEGEERSVTVQKRIAEERSSKVWENEDSDVSDQEGDFDLSAIQSGVQSLGSARPLPAAEGDTVACALLGEQRPSKASPVSESAVPARIHPRRIATVAASQSSS